MWRPKEGWDSIEIVRDILTSDEVETGMTASQKLVEAGANAVLKALKDRVGSRRNKGNSGWLVFIPDKD